MQSADKADAAPTPSVRARLANALRNLSGPLSQSTGKLLPVQRGEWLRDDALRRRAERHKNPTPAVVALTAWQAIGIVYGDIGTSPIYTLQTALQSYTSPPSPDDVLGVTSILVWVLTLLLVVKYTLIVLRADDDGEGGTFALYSLLRRAGVAPDADEAARSVGRGGCAAATATATDTPRATTVHRRRGAQWPSSGMRPASSPRLRASDSKTATDWRTRLVSARLTQRVLRVAVVVAVGCILGDGVLTPSISVVSAVEGLGLPLPNAFVSGSAANVGVSVVILMLLFLMQRAGTGGMAFLFSPVSAAYFVGIGAVGVHALAVSGAGLRVLSALSPHWAFRHFARHGYTSWTQLGSVALVITGAEALYADLGHFNRAAITIVTCGLVWPCLLAAYLGQAATLLATPTAWTDAGTNPAGTGGPFWASIPRAVYWPMLALTVAESVVASQAMISASFSVAAQAVATGFFPRLRIKHTSRSFVGQVYVRAVNYALLTLCVLVVCLFRTSTKIGDAYGIAVTALMLLTTMLMVLFMISVWRSPLPLVIAFGAVFILLEGALWTSTLLKTPNGGWLAIAMSAGWMAFMAVWLAGRGAHRRGLVATPLDALVVVDGSGGGVTKVPIEKRVDGSGGSGDGAITTTATTTATPRAPGVALFYTDEIDTADTAPPVLAHLLARLPACLFQVNICLHVRVVPLPEVAVHERLLARDSDVDGFYSVVARYGYLERPIHDAAFAAAVVDHVIGRLHDRLAVACATDPALATALDLPASFAADYSAWAAAVAAAADGDSLVSGSGGGSGGGVGGASVSVTTPAAAASVSPITAIKRALATAPAAPALPDRCAPARSAIAQIRVLETARDQQTSLFVLGRSDVELPTGGGASGRVRNVVLGMPFAVLCKIFNDDLMASYGVPRDQALQVVLPYDF